MNKAILIRVDIHDSQIGIVEKMTAHREGILHRAFSIFIFNSEGQWLLQQRAKSKYHSAGLWSNACCGHPLEGENTEEAAGKRLVEEMGMVCALKNIFSFTYRAEMENGLVEHEFDHVFIGFTDEIPKPNPEEVKGWKYVLSSELEDLMKAEDSNFTAWFKLIFEKVQRYHMLNYGIG